VQCNSCNAGKPGNAKAINKNTGTEAQDFIEIFNALKNYSNEMLT
jgi:hypothetical protein